jgi:hypothetical protein
LKQLVATASAGTERQRNQNANQLQDELKKRQESNEIGKRQKEPIAGLKRRAASVQHLDRDRLN